MTTYAAFIRPTYNGGPAGERALSENFYLFLTKAKISRTAVLHVTNHRKSLIRPWFILNNLTVK